MSAFLWKLVLFFLTTSLNLESEHVSESSENSASNPFSKYRLIKNSNIKMNHFPHCGNKSFKHLHLPFESIE